MAPNIIVAMAYTIHAYLLGDSSYSRMLCHGARRMPCRDGAVLVASGSVDAMEALEMRDFPQTIAKNSTALRVLIVDDEPLIRWSDAETLADRGFEVVETGDARGARSAV